MNTELKVILEKMNGIADELSKTGFLCTIISN